MIIGLLLGISVAVFGTSLLMIFTSSTGIIRENLITGATIGTSGIMSYSIAGIIISLIAIFILVKILKNPKN